MHKASPDILADTFRNYLAHTLHGYKHENFISIYRQTLSLSLHSVSFFFSSFYTRYIAISTEFSSTACRDPAAGDSLTDRLNNGEAEDRKAKRDRSKRGRLREKDGKMWEAEPKKKQKRMSLKHL